MKFSNVILFILFISITSCHLFTSNEQKAISLVQETKSNDLFGIFGTRTWLDFAASFSNTYPNLNQEWHAQKIDSLENMYLTSFADKNKNNTGLHWEVNLKEKIVTIINGNDYLGLKYGYSDFDPNQLFIVDQVPEINVKKENRSKGLLEYFISDVKGDYITENIVTINTRLKNNTNKYITSVSCEGSVQLIFSDKKTTTVTSKYFKIAENVSKSTPWKPGEFLNITFKSNHIEDVYLNYSPQFTAFDISVRASDPIDFKYNQKISRLNLNDKWAKFINKPMENNIKQLSQSGARQSTETINEQNIKQNKSHKILALQNGEYSYTKKGASSHNELFIDINNEIVAGWIVTWHNSRSGVTTPIPTKTIIEGKFNNGVIDGKLYYSHFEGGTSIDEFTARVSDNLFKITCKGNAWCEDEFGAKELAGEYTFTTFDNLKFPEYEKGGGKFEVIDLYNSTKKGFFGEWTAYTIDMKFKFPLVFSENDYSYFSNFMEGNFTTENDNEFSIGVQEGCNFNYQNKTDESFTFDTDCGRYHEFVRKNPKYVAYKTGSLLQLEYDKIYLSNQ